MDWSKSVQGLNSNPYLKLWELTAHQIKEFFIRECQVLSYNRYDYTTFADVRLLCLHNSILSNLEILVGIRQVRSRKIQRCRRDIKFFCWSKKGLFPPKMSIIPRIFSELSTITFFHSLELEIFDVDFHLETLTFREKKAKELPMILESKFLVQKFS